MITVYSQPATEPLTIAEVMTHLRIDESNQEPAPGVITAALISPAAAGNVNTGVHRYLCTFVTSAGETQAGDISAAVTVVDSAINGKVSLTAIPLGGGAVTTRKLYRTVAGGSQYLLLATLADNTTTTYTDNIADASLGAEAPSVNTTSDPYLSMLIKAARQAAELELHRYLITQTIDAYYDDFQNEFLLPPIQSVSALTYIDENEVEQTLSASYYDVDAVSIPARVRLADGYSWPTTFDKPNVVKIRAIVGYGASAAVPECIKHWMLVKISTMYETREQYITGTILSSVPQQFIDALLDPERVHGRTA